MFLRSTPLVLAAAIALSGCQTAMPGVTMPDLPAATTPASATTPVQTAADASAPAVPASQADVRSLTGLATYQGAPLAGYDVTVFDAATGEPLPLVSSFLDPAAPHYAVQAVGDATGSAVLAQGLVTDDQGGFSLRLRGLAQGQAVKVVVARGDVSIETLMTADEDDLDPQVTDEVDDSFLLGDPAAVSLLNPDATPPVSGDELLADAAFGSLSADELDGMVTDDDVDAVVIERAIARGDLDAADPALADLSAATGEEIASDGAVADAEGTVAMADDDADAGVVSEAIEPGAAGYVIFSSGLLAHRSLLGTKPSLVHAPPRALPPRGKLVKGPDGRLMLEVALKAKAPPSAATKSAFSALVKQALLRNTTALRLQLSKASLLPNAAARVQAGAAAKAVFAANVKREYGTRHDPVAVAMMQLIRGGEAKGQPALDAYLAQFQSALDQRAEQRDKTIARAQMLTKAQQLALKRRAAAQQKVVASKRLLGGKPALTLDQRVALDSAKRQQQAAMEARLKAAGVMPRKPTIVTRPDGTQVAVVQPKIVRQVNEVTTAESKLVSGALQASRILSPAAAGPVMAKTVQSVRTLAPKLTQTFKSNPSVAGQLVRSSANPGPALGAIVVLAGAKKDAIKVVTGLVTDVAQRSKVAGNLSQAATNPAVLEGLKHVDLPGTVFSVSFDPSKGVLLANNASGQAVDASSTSAVEAQVVAATATSGSSGSTQPSGPSITSLSSTAFAVGDTLTISGTGFSATAADNHVSFGGTAATPTAAGATSLTVTVPTGAVAGNLTVTVNGSTTGGSPYFVYRTGLPTTTFATLARFYGGISAGLVVDGADNVYAAQPALGTSDAPSVACYDKSGTLTATLTDASIQEATAIALDKQGNLYIADGRGYQGVTGNKIVRYDATAHTYSTFVTGVNNPTGMAFDSAGNFYVASYGDSKVYKYHADGTAGTAFATGLRGKPYGIAFDASNNLYVGINTENNTSSRVVQKVTTAGVVSDFYVAATAVYEPYSVVVDPKGSVWVTMYNTSKIVRIAPDGTGTLYNGSNCMNGIGFDSTGAMFTIDNTRKISKMAGAAPPSK